MATENEIKLGDKVRCKLTGLTGIAVQRVENLNGCIQYTVRTPVTGDGKLLDQWCIDYQNLEVLERDPHELFSANTPVKKRTGGADSRPAKSA